MDRNALFRRLAHGTTVAMAALIVFGGIVRITESGLGCGDDWPLCNGEVVPTFTFPVAIEYTHRLIAAAVVLMTFGLAGLGWTRYRTQPALRRPTTLAAALIVIQVLLGAVTVWLELPPVSVILHFGTALATLTAVLVATLRARADAAPPMAVDRFTRWALGTAALGAGVLLLGAWVAGIDAGAACVGFPLCNGQLLPGPGLRIHVHWAHRLMAYGFVFAVLALTAMAYRERGIDRRLLRAQWSVVLATGAQIAVAAAMILHLLPSGLRALHLAVGTGVWVTLVILVYFSRHPSAAVPAEG